MDFEHINWLAVLVVAIINTIIGIFWYSPKVLGDVWAETLQIRDVKPSILRYIGGFVVALIMSWVLALLANELNLNSITAGAATGFFIWLGLIAAPQFQGVIWAKKPIRVYVIDIGYYLVALVIMMSILSIWR